MTLNYYIPPTSAKTINYYFQGYVCNDLKSLPYHTSKITLNYDSEKIFAMKINYYSTDTSGITLNIADTLASHVSLVTLRAHASTSLCRFIVFLCQYRRLTTTSSSPHGTYQIGDEPFRVVYIFYRLDHSALRISGNASSLMSKKV